MDSRTMMNTFFNSIQRLQNAVIWCILFESLSRWMFYKVLNDEKQQQMMRYTMVY